MLEQTDAVTKDSRNS